MTFCSLVSKIETKNLNSHSDVALCKIEKLQIQQQCPAFWSAARNKITYLAKKKKKKKSIMKVVWEIADHLKVLCLSNIIAWEQCCRGPMGCVHFSDTQSNCWQMYHMISSQNFKAETFSSVLWIMRNLCSNWTSGYLLIWWRVKSPIKPQHVLQLTLYEDLSSETVFLVNGNSGLQAFMLRSPITFELFYFTTHIYHNKSYLVFFCWSSLSLLQT